MFALEMGQGFIATEMQGGNEARVFSINILTLPHSIRAVYRKTLKVEF